MANRFSKPLRIVSFILKLNINVCLFVPLYIAKIRNLFCFCLLVVFLLAGGLPKRPRRLGNVKNIGSYTMISSDVLYSYEGEAVSEYGVRPYHLKGGASKSG